MPCDTIQTNSVQLDAMHFGLLKPALEAMGATDITERRFYFNGRTYTIEGGRLEAVTDAATVGATADLMRQHYSAQAVQYAAAANGWQVQQTGPLAFNIIKGY